MIYIFVTFTILPTVIRLLLKCHAVLINDLNAAFRGL